MSNARERSVWGGWGRSRRAARDRWVWALALGLFVVGDVATTWVGLSLGLVESHPVASSLFGVVGFWPAVVAGKGLVVALALGQGELIARWLGRPEWSVAPAWALSLMGAGIVAWNSRLILLAV